MLLQKQKFKDRIQKITARLFLWYIRSIGCWHFGCLYSITAHLVSLCPQSINSPLANYTAFIKTLLSFNEFYSTQWHFSPSLYPSPVSRTNLPESLAEPSHWGLCNKFFIGCQKPGLGVCVRQRCSVNEIAWTTRMPALWLYLMTCSINITYTVSFDNRALDWIDLFQSTT